MYLKVVHIRFSLSKEYWYVIYNPKEYYCFTLIYYK